MTIRSNWRGHATELRQVGREDLGERWVYSDTGQLVSSNPDRPCGSCGRANTPEGHDGCLGTLPNVMNACCGHGCELDAYVQFWDGRELRKAEAREWQERHAKPCPLHGEESRP